MKYAKGLTTMQNKDPKKPAMSLRSKPIAIEEVYPRLFLFLIVLEVLTGVSAIGGALFAIPTMPLKDLEGTLFTSYLIPALALGIIVGGSMLFAAFFLLTHHVKKGRIVSLFAGISLMFYELVEVYTIGLVHALQPICFFIGIAIVICTLKLSVAALF